MTISKERLLTILDQAKEKIEQGGWTQKAFARNKDGMSVGDREDDAVCWCLAGAIFAVSEFNENEVLFNLRTMEANRRGYECGASFNDHPGRTKEEVLEFIASMRKTVEQMND